MSRARLERGALALFALVAVGLCYWRLYYGVDFTDEAWYVAVPYRFALGGTPYVDELSVPQTTAGALLTPFVALYHLLAGTTGIVLFVRHLHFLVALGVGAAVTAALRPLAGGRVALLAGLAAFAFVPFDIPSVSYDSLGTGMLTAGLLLAFLGRSRPRVTPLAGLCLGLAAFSYPPLVLAVALCCGLRLWLARERWRAEALALVAPAFAVPVAGFAALAALAGPHRIIADYRRSSHYLGQAGGLSKVGGIAAHLKDTLPLWWLAAAGLIFLVWSWRRWPRLAALVLVLFPLALLPTAPNSYSASLNFVAHLGFVALGLLAVLWRRREARELFLTVWVPAALGGFLTGYSSANGGVNFGVGFFPAVVVSLVFAAWAVAELADVRLAPLPVALATGLLLYLGVVPVYRDAALSALDVQVGSGPYAGLFTNPPKQAFLTRLHGDLAGVDGRCTIAFFDNFPAGYLLTSARPDTSAVWTATVPARLTFAYHQDLVDWYETHGYPDVVVEMLRIPFALPRSARREHYASADPLIRAIASHGYRETVARVDYVVYRRPAAGCPA